jgi:hypothetical protein
MFHAQEIYGTGILLPLLFGVFVVITMCLVVYEKTYGEEIGLDPDLEALPEYMEVQHDCPPPYTEVECDTEYAPAYIDHNGHMYVSVPLFRGEYMEGKSSRISC